MKKTVWICFAISLVLVNLFAWGVQQYADFYIPMILRLMMVLGVTMGSIVFAGAFALVNKFDEERPLTGHGDDTLQKRPVSQTPAPPKK